MSVRLLLLLVWVEVTVGSPQESRLINELFKDTGYEKHIRPAPRFDVTVQVNFSLGLNVLLDVDEKSQTMTISCFTTQEWTDKRLMWNPANHSDMEDVVIPADLIWKPTIIMPNTANGEYYVPQGKDVVLHHTGVITNDPPAIFTTPCEMNLRKFPFDIQQCSLKFAVCQYSADKILFSSADDKVAMWSQTKSSEWKIQDTSIINSGYVMDGRTYDKVIVTFTLQRMPLYYLVNIVLPCLMTALLTVLLFLLPSDCGEKMSFGVSILISVSVFTLLVADIMPATSDSVPLIMRFLIFDLAFVALSILATVFVLRLHHRSKKDLAMKPWIKKLFMIYLPYWLCMKPYARCFPVSVGSYQTEIKNPLPDTESEATRGYESKRPDEMKQALPSFDGNTQLLNEIRDEIKTQNEKIIQDDKEKCMEDDWKYVASVLDRLFLILGLIMFAIAVILMYNESRY